MQEGLIQIRNLSKKFGGTYALKNINFSVNRGEIFGIIGMSGAGKSTLIRCLACLDKPSSGQIFFHDQELTALSEKQLRAPRKKMGMIFQQFNLFSSRTALENIVYPLEIDHVPREQRLSRAKELIAIVGLEGKEHLYPAQLSGGEKQRVAIARALSRNPDILLCDEATSALDPRNTQAILELLARLNSQLSLTIILITHEMEVIKQICTQVAVLEQGGIVEQGATAQLFAMPHHPTTKRFLQSVTHAIPDYFLPKEKDQELLRLSFTGRSSSQPIISRLIREHEVEVNILLGGIDILRSETVGILVIGLTGASHERQKALQFLEKQGVLWEKVA